MGLIRDGRNCGGATTRRRRSGSGVQRQAIGGDGSIPRTTCDYSIGRTAMRRELAPMWLAGTSASVSTVWFRRERRPNGGVRNDALRRIASSYRGVSRQRCNQLPRGRTRCAEGPRLIQDGQPRESAGNGRERTVSTCPPLPKRKSGRGQVTSRARRLRIRCLRDCLADRTLCQACVEEALYELGRYQERSDHGQEKREIAGWRMDEFEPLPDPR